mgnify:FL=1
MAQVVAFDAFAPRIARRQKTANRANGDSVFGKVILFTGVWHERVERSETVKDAKRVRKPKK